MDLKEHFRSLETLFLTAPINRIHFPQATIHISSGKSEITWKSQPGFFHALGALHGSIIFKWLDDAAYFAAASKVVDYFLLTKSFEINFLRPGSSQTFSAIGEIQEIAKSEILAKASLLAENGKVVASGSGIFVRSKTMLSAIPTYQPLN